MVGISAPKSPISRLCWSSLTFLQGFEDTSKEALKARLCCVVRMVLGRLGLLESLLSSPFPWPMPFSCLMSNSSSSLFSADRSIGIRLRLRHQVIYCCWYLTLERYLVKLCDYFHFYVDLQIQCKLLKKKFSLHLVGFFTVFV